MQPIAPGTSGASDPTAWTSSPAMAKNAPAPPSIRGFGLARACL